MKKIFLLLPILVIIIFAYSESLPAKISKDGIIFSEISWAEAVKQSTTENKLILLDFSTSWCGYCKKMKRTTFSDKEVGTFFNDKFINISIDAEKGEGVALAKKYQISAYPTLLITDKNGNVLQGTQGYINAGTLIQLGKSALSK